MSDQRSKAKSVHPELPELDAYSNPENQRPARLSLMDVERFCTPIAANDGGYGALPPGRLDKYKEIIDRTFLQQFRWQGGRLFPEFTIFPFDSPYCWVILTLRGFFGRVIKEDWHPSLSQGSYKFGLLPPIKDFFSLRFVKALFTVCAILGSFAGSGALLTVLIALYPRATIGAIPLAMIFIWAGAAFIGNRPCSHKVIGTTFTVFAAIAVALWVFPFWLVPDNQTWEQAISSTGRIGITLFYSVGILAIAGMISGLLRGYGYGPASTTETEPTNAYTIAFRVPLREFKILRRGLFEAVLAAIIGTVACSLAVMLGFALGEIGNWLSPFLGESPYPRATKAAVIGTTLGALACVVYFWKREIVPEFKIRFIQRVNCLSAQFPGTVPTSVKSAALASESDFDELFYIARPDWWIEWGFCPKWYYDWLLNAPNVASAHNHEWLLRPQYATNIVSPEAGGNFDYPANSLPKDGFLVCGRKQDKWYLIATVPFAKKPQKHPLFDEV